MRHDGPHLSCLQDRRGPQYKGARLFDAKQIGATPFTQDGDCRGDPHEDHHPNDSRRQPAHQTGLVMAVTVVTFVAAMAAFVAAAKAEAALAEATLATAFAEAALAAFIAA